MRILHVITTIDRGGAENHLYALVRGQKAAGHDVAVAFLKGSGEWGEGYRDLHVSVHDLGMRRYGDLRPLPRLRKLVKGADVVHAHLPPAEFYARLALLGMPQRARMVISKHNDNPFYGGPLSGWLARWVAKRADSVIAISDAVNRYMQGAGLPAGKLKTVHYGMSPVPPPSIAEVERLRAQWGVGERELLFVTVARLVPQKALHVLVEAYRRYRAMSVVPSRLCIVGDGPLRDALMSQVRESGLDPHVVLAGRRADIPVVMRAQDVFVLSSVHEGFGLVLLEAMDAARPIIATRVSAIPEVVEDGVSGTLVTSDDPDAFAAAMLAMEDSRLRARFGEAGRAGLLERFPVERMVSQTLAVYSEALRSGA